MTSDHQKGCCTRCKEIQIVKGKPLHEGGGYPFMVCNNAACSCHKELADNTAEPSIREGFVTAVREQLDAVAVGECPVNPHDAIMTAFDSALEQIALAVEGEAFVQPAQAGQFGMHADGFNQGVEEAAAIIRSNKSS